VAKVAGSCNFPTQLQIFDSKIHIKKQQRLPLLRFQIYSDITLFSSVQPFFSEFVSENSLPVNAFSAKIFRQKKCFPTLKFGGGATVPFATMLLTLKTLPKTMLGNSTRSKVKVNQQLH